MRRPGEPEMPFNALVSFDFFFSRNTRKSSYRIGQQKHKRKERSSLESHFMVTILPVSRTVSHFAAVWSRFVLHCER